MMIERATLLDLPTLVEHRRAMFHDMGFRDEALLRRVADAFEQWLPAKMNDGEYEAWLARGQDGSVVAGAGVWYMEWIPNVRDLGERRANILNVYTRPDWRRRGMGKRMMQVAMERCRELGLQTVVLHASDEGRPVYESLGFTANNEMRLSLR